METISPNELRAAEDLGGWDLVPAVIRRTYRTGSLAAGLAFANRVGEAADEANHHPDLLITYPTITVTLTSHDADGLTDRDLSLARRIDRIASQLDLSADD